MGRYGRDFEHRNWLERAGDAVERWFGGSRDDYDRDFLGRPGMERGRFDDDRWGRPRELDDREWRAWNRYDRDFGDAGYRGGHGGGWNRGEMERGMGGRPRRGMEEMRGRGSWQGDSYRSTNRDMERDWGARGWGRDDERMDRDPSFGREYGDVDYGWERQSRSFRGDARDVGRGSRDATRGRQDRAFGADAGMRGTDGDWGDYRPYPGEGRWRGPSSGGVAPGRYFTGYGGTNARRGSGYEPLA